MRGARADTEDDHRFVLRETLGSGGMGVVYRAFDRQLGREVALKKLRTVTGRDLYRFKREFRALADIIHPNLVTLHELHTLGEDWFFTMELVEGVPFSQWVRHRPATARAPGDEWIDDLTLPTAAGVRRHVLEAPLDLARLDDALPQLIDGVLALHVAGKLHRDLKPSNVLVAGDGRVVLLDFGLIATVHHEAENPDLTHDQAAVGTPVYMSPEQAADRPLTPASDWYAVGVMLYEALTGRRPLEGPGDEVIRRKQRETPRPPQALAPDAPPALASLAMQLLDRDPSRRGDGRGALAVLGCAPSAATVQLERAAVVAPFLGRRAELDRLHRAFDDARDHAVAVVVGGESGIGKSRLVRRFLDELDDRAVILDGRCYARESVPFKALDSVIDALTGVLLRLRDADVRDAVPVGSGALTRLFPVLSRVPALAAAAFGGAAPSPQELRRRALTTLRGLIGWLARRERLVIVIDDLQWGDRDSAGFLSDLVHDDDSPPILMVLIHRGDDDSDVVEAVRHPVAGLAGGDVRTLDLASLAADDARALARAVADRAIADDVVRESHGHPLFLLELARSAAGPGSAAPSLDELIARRAADLPPAAAQLLRTIAVAARPLTREDAALAAGLDDISGPLAPLVARRLVRLRHGGPHDQLHVEPFHDRVREAVVAALPDRELRHAHAALMRMHETRGDAGDLDALVAHSVGAGDRARAGRYARRAAEVARDALAFNRAADLYAVALDADDGTPGERGRLERRRRGALVDAGRLAEAAEAIAAEASSSDQALVLEQLELQQLLGRGQRPESVALIRRLLARIGIALPDDASATIPARPLSALPRADLSTPRRDDDLPPEALRRIDLLQALATPLAFADPWLGLRVQGHLLSTALEAGEPRRIAVALASELAYAAMAGVHAEARLARGIDEVRALVEPVADPRVNAAIALLLGLVAFRLGQWRSARDRLGAGIAALSELGAGVGWELDLARIYHLTALFYLGEARELATLVPGLVRDAAERGRLFARNALRSWRPNVAWLIRGRPDIAREQLDAVETEPDGFAQLRQYHELVSHVDVELYCGDVDRAWRRFQDAWPALIASPILRIEMLHLDALSLQARVSAASAYALASAERRNRLAHTVATTRALARSRAPWARALYMQARAMVAVASGDPVEAATRLDDAARAFAACDMTLFAAVARLRRGQLEGGAAGKAEVAAAKRVMTDQAVADPDAFARTLWPWPT